MSSLNILFVGWLVEGTTSKSRFDAISNLGHKVIGIDINWSQLPWAHKFLNRLSYKLFRMGFNNCGPLDFSRKNKIIVQMMEEENWDVVWIEKGLIIERTTLTKVRQLNPNCRIIGYSPDDMYARHSQSRQFLQSLPLYDIYFTTKSYGVAELQSLGAQEVYFIGNAYDPSLHRPITITTKERERLGGRVGFIGAYEDERCRSIEYLISNGVPVRVWGGLGWKQVKSHGALRIETQSLWGDDYAKGICSFDINLGFLRKVNRDLQTQRSVEIPACGAFMLAERTEEHQALFEEGKEAEYFDSDEEMLDKVNYYLSHEDERKRIAAAGRERCIRSGYSNEARIAHMLEIAMKDRRHVAFDA